MLALKSALKNGSIVKLLVALYSLGCMFYFIHLIQEAYAPYADDPNENTLLSFNLVASYSLAMMLTFNWLALPVIMAKKHLTSVFCKQAILSIAAYFLLNYGLQESAKHMSDFRTYSYEALLTGYYICMSAVLTLGLTLLLYPCKFKTITKLLTGVSFISLLFLTFEGRGSVEQLDLLIGGIIVESSWEMWQRSVTSQILPLTAIIFAIFPFLFMISGWVSDGSLSLAGAKHTLKVAICFYGLFGATFLSIPFGSQLNAADIRTAQNYIEKIVPHLTAYYEKHAEFPRDLKQLAPELTNAPPRMLRIYEYLANDYRGAYYYSRPEKYCFIFKNQNEKADFYSLTNERGWQSSHSWQSLENNFAEICDDGGDASHQNLIAGHLGLSDFDNPLDELALEAGVPLIPAVTQRATPHLEREIEILGIRDPSIYGDQNKSSFNADDTPNIEALRFQVMNGPVEDPEEFTLDVPSDEELGL